MVNRLVLLAIVASLLFRPYPVQAQQCRFEMGLSDQYVDTRYYALYVPDGLTEPAPLIISLHGFGSNALHHSERTHWNQIADEYGLVIVYPEGLGLVQYWASGDLEANLAFIQTIITRLTASHCIDSSRIYVNGFSNGGGFAYQIACRLADQITAVGLVAATIPSRDLDCDPQRSVPVIAFHGTEDHIVAYNGTIGLRSVTDWTAAWAAQNGCDVMIRIFPIGDDVSEVKYTGCDAEVLLFTVNGGGHAWPGGGNPARLNLGKITQDINASAVMWEFFSDYRLRRRTTISTYAALPE